MQYTCTRAKVQRHYQVTHKAILKVETGDSAGCHFFLGGYSRINPGLSAWNLFQQCEIWQKSAAAELAQAPSVDTQLDCELQRKQSHPRNRKPNIFVLATQILQVQQDDHTKNWIDTLHTPYLQSFTEAQQLFRDLANNNFVHS